MFGVALPVGEVVGRIGREPEAEAHAVTPGGVDDRLEPAREPLGVDGPEVGVEGVEPIPHPAAPLRLGGVARHALLPAVVDLHDVNPELRAGLDLLEDERLANAAVAMAVAPGVAELAHDRAAEPAALVLLQRAEASEPAAGVGQHLEGVAVVFVEEQVEAARLDGLDLQVGLLPDRPGVGQRGRLEQDPSLPRQRVLHDEEVAAQHQLFRRVQQPRPFLDQLVVAVGPVGEDHLRQPQMRPVDVQVGIGGRLRPGGRVAFNPLGLVTHPRTLGDRPTRCKRGARPASIASRRTAAGGTVRQ